MSRLLYQFWGNYFLNLARGQQQIDNLAAMMKQSLMGMNDLTARLCRWHGLEGDRTADSPSVRLSRQIKMVDFQQSLNRFAVLWGWVPQAEYQRVIRECNTLKDKVEDQAAVICQLRDMLAKNGRGHTMLIEHWKRSFEEQNTQFKSLMKSIGRSFVKDR